MKIRAPLTLFLLLATIVNADDRPPAVHIGDKVPDFTITALNGTPYKLSELQKNTKLTESGVTVLTFWCSFCHSCRDVEHPLSRLAEKYQGRALVVALDSSFGETAEDVAAFQKQQGLTVPIALDPSGQVADHFGAKVTTTTVVIDGQGKLRYFGQFAHGHDGYTERALEAVLADRDVRHQRTPQRG